MKINKISGNYANDIVLTWELGSFSAQQLDFISKHSKNLFKSGSKQTCVLNIFQLEKIAHEIPAFIEIFNNERIIWAGKNFKFDLTTSPIIYAIFNLSPESFFTHEADDVDTVLKSVEESLANGAKVIELGGKSTKPNYDSSAITPEVEWNRVKKFLVPIRKAFPECVIAVDTYNPEVMKKSLDYGANILNDITGFQDEEKIQLLKAQHPAILPMFNDREIKYDDPVKSMISFFSDLINKMETVGIPRESILLDPGIGYSHNSSSKEDISKLASYKELSKLGCPLLTAISRKSFMGKQFPNTGSLEMTLLSELRTIQNGSRVLRVHDIKETKDLINFVSLTI